MNDTLDYKISVMQAAKEGRQIYRMPRGGEWSFDPNPTWDWAFNDYRVKAREPRRVWITHFKNEALAPCTSSSRSAAETFLIHAGQGDVSEFIELTQSIRERLDL